jgi:DNA-binding helix-hairpin-helix protein with protein kinase domain
MRRKQGVAPGLSPGGKIWLDKVRTLVLGKLIKSGGAGSVYLLPGAPAQVAKLYHPHLDRAANRRKLEAMLELSPELPDQLENGKRYVQIAWPQAAVFDGQGGFAGFVMPLLDMAQTAELEQIMQERQARAAGLPTGLGPKLTLAANLAAVIDALHQQQHYVVDLKPVNLRFYRDSLYIAMLDCDGFSIQGHAERFPAEQFTADYLAPEFQRKGMPAGTELRKTASRWPSSSSNCSTSASTRTAGGPAMRKWRPIFPGASATAAMRMASNATSSWRRTPPAAMH